MLDADDYLLPGRFSRLMGALDWDLIADQIVFAPASAPKLLTSTDLPNSVTESFRTLDLTGFVAGNLNCGRAERRELGFLKPVIARRFLDDHALRYQAALWLGEDYDLYVRILLAGARFRVTSTVGYVARVSANSLSGRHRTADLAALRSATAAHLQHPGLDEPARAALHRHHLSIRNRHLLRAFLDAKTDMGPKAAIDFALRPFSNLPPIISGLLRDKLLRPHLTRGAHRFSRYLLPIDA